MPTDPAAEARQRLADQAAEYGTYVAKGPIEVGGVRAFNEGDPVPKSHVDRGIVDKSEVAKVGTKAAEAVTGPEA